MMEVTYCKHETNELYPILKINNLGLKSNTLETIKEEDLPEGVKVFILNSEQWDRTLMELLSNKAIVVGSSL
jgi:hypothetical protein